eukprot:6046917-Ditylum_brightwellii.AAC.1
MSTSTDSLTSYFKSLEDCRYAVLCSESIPCGEDVKDNSLIQHEVNNDGGKECSGIISKYNENERRDIHSFCVRQRSAVDAAANVKMVLGTAWTHTHLIKVAKCYGDVIFVDATEDTNKGERALLTESTRKSLMKQVITL